MEEPCRHRRELPAARYSMWLCRIADGAERVSSRYTCVSPRQPFQHRAYPSYNRAFARIVVSSLQ
jgi:hypothetical protein